MGWIKFLARFWSDFKAFRIFAKFLTAVAVLALILWAILSLFVDGKTKTAPISYHEQRANNEYKARIHFENLEFLLRSRTIATIKAISVKWENDINSSLISDIKAQNRYFIFTSKELIKPDIKNLGVLSYQISFAPFIKTLFVYYVGLLVLGFVFSILWRHYRKASLYALAFIIFCLVILSLDGAKIEQLHLVPFGIIAFVLFVVCVFGAWRVKNSRLKLFLAYFSVIPLCSGIAEFWLFFSQDKTQMTQPHEILSYANTPLYNGKAKLIVDDKVIYDISYTHDGYGNRITPNNNENSKKCIAIYGGSFAYGAAVDSNESLESFLAKELPEYRLLNFGISAAGAHTALARLEFQIDKRVLEKCEEFIAIYEAIPHHIYRAYGAHMGANYQLDSNGNLHYWGTYKDEYSHKRFWQKNPPKITPQPQEAVSSANALKKIHNAFKDIVRLQGKFDKSYIKQKLFVRKSSIKSEDLLLDKLIFGLGFYSAVDYAKLSPNEINLYFSIVSRIQEELQAQYGVPLYIVLWDNDMAATFFDKYDATLKANFRQMGVPFWTLSEMIEDYPQDLERVKRGDYDNFKYRVSRWDTHPNALANQKIAEFLARKIKNGEIKSHKIKGTK